MGLYSFTCQCVRIGDEALISSGFLPSGNGAHTPGRLEQIRAFSFPGVVCKMANSQTAAALWSVVLSGNTRRSKRHTATRHSSKSEISADRHLANHLALADAEVKANMIREKIQNLLCLENKS